MKRSLKAIFSVVFALVMAFTATTAFTTDVFADGQNTAAGYYYDYQVLTVGTHELTPQDGVVTLYDFSTSETGEFTFTLSDENAFVGYYGSNEWYPSVPATLSHVVTVNHTEVGRPILIGVSGTTSVTITITKKGEAQEEERIPVEVYDNTATLEEFTLPAGFSPDDCEYVDIDDTVEDVPVLGADGYYHLNTADGPVLFAELDSSIVSLIGMFSYGQLKAAVYDEQDNPVKIVNFFDAFYEYIEATGGSYDFDNLTFEDRGIGYYPLTDDLITMFKMLGKANEWYESTGVVGGALPEGDAWMFACAYDADITTLEDEIVQAPDTTDSTVWVAYGTLCLAVAAFFVLVKKTK